MDLSGIKNAMDVNGFVLLSDIDKGSVDHISELFGNVIMRTNVKADPHSKPLVTSCKALSLHTDHHKADYIAWYCVVQASEGGKSILLDTKNILSRFTDEELLTMESIKLMEHCIFENDKTFCSLIRKDGDRWKVYFSFWMPTTNLTDLQKSVYQKFCDVVKESSVIEMLLNPRDLLIIDNSRILHGRTSIDGNKERFLIRHWIGKENYVKLQTS